MSYILLR